MDVLEEYLVIAGGKQANGKNALVPRKAARERALVCVVAVHALLLLNTGYHK